MFESIMLWKNNVNSCRLNVRNEGYAEVLILKMIYISKFRKDIKPLKIKFRKTIRNGARIYTPDFWRYNAFRFQNRYYVILFFTNKLEQGLFFWYIWISSSVVFVMQYVLAALYYPWIAYEVFMIALWEIYIANEGL